LATATALHCPGKVVQRYAALGEKARSPFFSGDRHPGALSRPEDMLHPLNEKNRGVI
jgi:hypothetical protein